MEIKVIDTRDIPAYAEAEICKIPFNSDDYGTPMRRCNVYIAEKDAVTFLDPESFSFCDVYGNCELLQIVAGEEMRPILIAKYEHSKNHRSMEAEAAAQMQKETIK